jgi:hypothetical protein
VSEINIMAFWYGFYATAKIQVLQLNKLLVNPLECNRPSGRTWLSLSTSAETYLHVLRRIIFSKMEGTVFKTMPRFSDLELLHARTRLYFMSFCTCIYLTKQECLARIAFCNCSTVLSQIDIPT